MLSLLNKWFKNRNWKSFLLKENVLGNIRNHIIFWLLLFFCLFFGDFLLSILGISKVVWLNKQSSVFTIVAFFACFVVSFASLWCKILVIICFCLPVISHTTYIIYSGSHLGCDEFVRGFVEMDDVAKNAVVVVKYFLLLLLPILSLLVFSIKFRKRFYKSLLCDFFVICGFFKIVHMAVVNDFLYAVPVPTRITLVNTMRTLPYCLVHLKDKENFNYPDDVLDEVKVKLVNKNTPRVVVIIWGESTNADFMSAFGNTRFVEGASNTPFLDSLFKKQENFVVMKAVSGSVATRASATLFFNLIGYPTDFKTISMSKKQNLFSMARENGYKTYWISADSSNLTEGGAFDVDYLVSKDTHKILPDSERDDYILNEVKKLDVSKGKHFIGIQFNSAHEMYSANYANHPEFDVEKVASSDNRMIKFRKEYRNNMRYLDWLIAEVVKWGQKNGVDVIVYTADHGEILGLDEAGNDGPLFGHNYHGLLDANVPFFLYQKIPDKVLMNGLKNKKKVFHYEIAKLVANIIGYEVKDKHSAVNECYLFSSSLYGKGISVRKITRDKNGTLTEGKIMGLQEFFDKHYTKR